MSRQFKLAGAICGLVLASSVTAGAQDRSARGAEAPRPQPKISCLATDEAGRTLPNPNASYGCFQLEAQRNDCEALAKAGNTRGLALHCFGFEPSPQAPSAYASQPSRRGAARGASQ
jgi:hypothetical protein